VAQPMAKIVILGVILVLVLVGIITMLPDIIRYMKMRAM
jgi:hypothetical protein